MEYTNLKFQEKLDLKSYLHKDNIEQMFLNFYGLEREMLRVEDEMISTTDHPSQLGDKATHPYISTDYAEAQIETITDVHCCCIEDAIKFNNNLYEICAEKLEGNEYLWPFSLPPKFDINEIKEAQFGEGLDKTEYREYLTEKYGKSVQLISGVHFNFSFSEDVLEDMRKSLASEMTYKEFKNYVYLKLMNNYLYYKYLVTLFLSATPHAHESLGVEDTFAIRSGKQGYSNRDDLDIDYSSVESFKSSVEKCIEDKVISKEFEIYESIRLKTGKRSVINSILEKGIKYVEIRNIDVNPYCYGGIDVESMQFVEYVLLYCTFGKMKENKDLHSLIANGNDPYEYSDIINEDLNDIITFFKQFNYNTGVVEKFKNSFNEKNILTTKVKNDIAKHGYIGFGKLLGNEYKKAAIDKRFSFSVFSDLELSTQMLIRKAVMKGIKISVLDKSDNFIKLESNGKTEYVKQATKTSLDNYVNVEIMENKQVTNLILNENNIAVPKGRAFSDQKLALAYAKQFDGVVIKPKSTNFGIGISIFKNQVDDNKLSSAIEYALEFDSQILVEEFISGPEYRFLVIDNKIEGVLERVPANVIGDGVSTIEELVEEKNEHIFRGKNYVTPLEKIVVDEVVLENLSLQNLKVTSVIASGETVYLRNNSNISTGGDSIDRTDEVDEYYKNLALDAVKCLGVNICGVDLISDDFKSKNAKHAIIELNFNPAIHIHSFPYVGKERDVANAILKALKL